jgi:hypothetical protein
VAQLGLSSALRSRLEAAEQELRDTERHENADAPDPQATVERYRTNLLRLTEALQSDVERARAALSRVLGRITVEQRPDGTYAVLEMQPAALLLAAGVQMGLVAGGCKRTRLHVHANPHQRTITSA